MFERFTEAAREAVRAARRMAEVDPPEGGER